MVGTGVSYERCQYSLTYMNILVTHGVAVYKLCKLQQQSRVYQMPNYRYITYAFFMETSPRVTKIGVEMTATARQTNSW